MSNSALTIPRTAGIWRMCASGIGSRCPNQRKVINATRLPSAQSPRNPQAGTMQQLVDLGARHHAEITWDAVLERRGGGREANGFRPWLILETRSNQSAAERVASADAIHNFDLVPRRAVELAIGNHDRSPAIEQNQRILPQRDCNGLEPKSFLKRARHLVVPLCFKVLVGTALSCDAEDDARVLFGGDEDVDVRHQRLLNFTRFLGTPEFAAIVEIVADRQARFLRRTNRFGSDLRRRAAERRRDPADVEPASATERCCPVNFARRYLADR